VKILIMGLPGSGKTTLAQMMAPRLNAVWLNADEVRKEANDWDFSEDGRRRQSLRMRSLAEGAVGNNRTVIADFVCPTKKQENTLVQTMSYGWTQSKRVVSKTQTKCLRNLQNTTPGSRQRTLRCGHSL